MPSSNARKAKGERASSELFENVTNPFCGTLPDDLTVERTDKGLKVLKNGCTKSVVGFERKLPPASPQVKGKDVDLAKAIQEAAKLIGKAALPLYGGLATDVEGMRATMALAERSGGIVDHALSEAQYRNFKILQTTGWITTTLTEARNRADLFIIAGSDIHKLHPRFFETIVQDAGEAIVRFDERDVVQSWNRAAEDIYGYAAGEMIGQRLHRLVPPDLLEQGEVWWTACGC